MRITVAPEQLAALGQTATQVAAGLDTTLATLATELNALDDAWAGDAALRFYQLRHDVVGQTRDTAVAYLNEFAAWATTLAARFEAADARQ